MTRWRSAEDVLRVCCQCQDETVNISCSYPAIPILSTTAPWAIHLSKSASHSVYHSASGCNIITYLIIIINTWPMSNSQSSPHYHASLLKGDEYGEREKDDAAHWMMIIRCGRIKEAKWWRREDRKSPFQSSLLLCWAQSKPICSSSFSFCSKYIFHRLLFLLYSRSPPTKY